MIIKELNCWKPIFEKKFKLAPLRKWKSWRKIEPAKNHTANVKQLLVVPILECIVVVYRLFEKIVTKIIKELPELFRRVPCSSAGKKHAIWFKPSTASTGVWAECSTQLYKQNIKFARALLEPFSKALY